MKKILTILFTVLFCIIQANTQFAAAKESIQSCFEKALLKGDIKKAEEYLAKGAEINNEKECYLCYAIIRHKDESVDFLLKNGANPDGTTKLWTPLYFAIHDKNNNALDKLLKYGANPNKKASVPLLYHTVVKNNAYAFKKMLYAGAEPKQTFMGINTLQLVFSKNNEEMINSLIKFQQKDFKAPPTDINKSIELLNTIENGKPFYKAVKGENKLKKPIKVKYIDLSVFGDYNTDIYFAVSYLKDKELTIFIDNKYAHEPKEVIALLIAGNSIQIDKKNSKTEYLYQLGAQALMYEEFLIKNPKLRLNKSSRPIQTYFNPILTLIQKGKYDMNTLWLIAERGVFEKNIKETSPGFKNTDLNSYFEDL